MTKHPPTPFVAFLKASGFADFLRSTDGKLRLFQDIPSAVMALERASLHITASDARGLVYRRSTLQQVHSLSL